MDWDKYSKAPIAKKYKVPYQSTLVMISGTGEIGRVVAQTSKKMIKGLLDKAL